MTGPIAQIVALTCYGNAILAGRPAPQFFPANSTSQFCEYVKFVEITKPFFGKPGEKVVASTPDEWLASLRTKKVLGIRLHRTPENAPKVTDRMLAGFVGGGGTWMMEVCRGDGRSEFWASRWEVGDQQAKDSRVWRVTYGLLNEAKTSDIQRKATPETTDAFRKSLRAIHGFAERENCLGFAKCFATALTALDHPETDAGYNKDITPPGHLDDGATALLKASMSAWVFGGMGSWNDMGFNGSKQTEYESVSESLFAAINEAILTAANSGYRK
jgi:hypothetical protein